MSIRGLDLSTSCAPGENRQRHCKNGESGARSCLYPSQHSYMHAVHRLPPCCIARSYRGLAHAVALRRCSSLRLHHGYGFFGLGGRRSVRPHHRSGLFSLGSRRGVGLRLRSWFLDLGRRCGARLRYGSGFFDQGRLRCFRLCRSDGFSGLGRCCNVRLRY